MLPFANLSGDPEQEYFADGMVEDIITALSHIKWLSVIARNSSFVYKGKPVDLKQVGRDLDVRYVLEGSVRRAGNRVRITAQLILAETGSHLWAERYDRDLTDIFELQDEITLAVVAAIEPNVRAAELERVRHTRPDNLDVYDLILRALPYATRTAPDDVPRRRSRSWNAPARASSPEASPTSTRSSRAAFKSASSPTRTGPTKKAAIAHAHRALELGADDAAALAGAGFVVFVLRGRTRPARSTPSSGRCRSIRRQSSR